MINKNKIFEMKFFYIDDFLIQHYPPGVIIRTYFLKNLFFYLKSNIIARVIKLDFHSDPVGYRPGDITGHHLYRPGALFGYLRYQLNIFVLL